jgi:hypothetical protein
VKANKSGKDSAAQSSASEAKKYSRLAERGLGPTGGGWNLRQASRWSGIGENTLRTMAKNKQIDCAYYIGRRILLPREGFKRWFNEHSAAMRRS